MTPMYLNLLFLVAELMLPVAFVVMEILRNREVVRPSTLNFGPLFYTAPVSISVAWVFVSFTTRVGWGVFLSITSLLIWLLLAALAVYSYLWKDK